MDSIYYIFSQFSLGIDKSNLLIMFNPIKTTVSNQLYLGIHEYTPQCTFIILLL